MMLVKHRIIFTFFIMNLLFIIVCSVGCNPMRLPIIKDKVKEVDDYRTEKTKEAIKNNLELQELDDICRQVPLPEGFNLIGVHLTPNESPVLTYYYYSKNDFEESDNYFRDYFIKNGWKLVENNSLNKISDFRKDNYKVAIQYDGIGADANYGISCRKLLPPK